MRINTSTLSDKGPFREKNEDYFCAEKESGLFIVADGIGGSLAGEIASRMAVEVVKDYISSHKKPSLKQVNANSKYSQKTELLAEAVKLANKSIFDTSKNNASYHGMGTTLTAAFINDERLSIAHVGDSRAYLFRAGSLQQLTNDHSLVADQVRLGLISEKEANSSTIKHVITRSLGARSELEVDVSEISLADGDRLILCSDGISSVLSDNEISALAINVRKTEDFCEKLITSSTDAGSRDNMTAVVADIFKGTFSHLFNNIAGYMGRK